MRNLLVTKGTDLYINVFDEKGKLLREVRVLKGFESITGWFWFVTEERIEDGDNTYFGLVQGFEEEWGYFTRKELESLGPHKVWEIDAKNLPYAGRRTRAW